MSGPDKVLRIAAWSGPRNISTAMMRAWENRPDTVVVDEPFYASYLARTNLEHPGREQVLASQDKDWRKVSTALTRTAVEGAQIYYQKHMAHHIFEDMMGAWLDELTHVFLIRDPASMVVSLDRVIPNPRLADTGLPQQLRIFERTSKRLARPPPVLSAMDVLDAPAVMLGKLCAQLGLAFLPAMLRWPSGPRDSDGVWAPYWYANVWKSTGFMPPSAAPTQVPDRLQPLLNACLPIYEKLYACRIKP